MNTYSPTPICTEKAEVNLNMVNRKATAAAALMLCITLLSSASFAGHCVCVTHEDCPCYIIKH